MMPNDRISRRDWLAAAALTVAGAELAGCDRSPAPPPKPKPPLPFAGDPPPDRPNIVVFLADTLRADHLACYGYPLVTAPAIEWLAATGVVFERNVSGSTWTKPALGTALTGVPARVHQAVVSSPWRGIVDQSEYRVQTLRDVFETLPQALKRVGYTTAYLQANAHGRPEFGYGRGFDFTRTLSHYPAHLQVSDAIDWLNTSVQQPFFLFIHEIDPHGPYVASDSSFRNLHGISSSTVFEQLDPAEAERVKRYVELLGMGPVVTEDVRGVSEQANRYIKMQYDAEIFEISFQLQRLVKYIARTGINEHTIYVITSDHGEAFGEHGYYAHAFGRPYRELLNVPLIMTGAGLPKNVRVPHTTTMIDFYPTLLEIAGAPVPEYTPGTPMISSRGEVLVTNDRLAYVDLDYESPNLQEWDAAIVKGRYKVATRKQDGERWIFDCELDPGEHHNLAGSDQLPPELEQELVADLQAEVERYEQLSREFGEPEWTEADDQLREDLEALGYV